jgi:putative FmdB family regulatory protein
MPIYEYQCSKCGHHHEALQKISDPPLRKCPDCGRQTLTRLVSAVRFRLSGSGWYETDFKSEQETKRNLADRGVEPAAEKKEATEAPATSAEKPVEKSVVTSKPVAKPAPRARTTTKATSTTARPAARKRPAGTTAKKRH